MKSSGRQRQWDAIDATADKLFQVVEGLPDLELYCNGFCSNLIEATLDNEGSLTIEIREPAWIRIEICSTPALALTILDAVRAYAKLNGLLVCHTCGHPRHSPLLCTELLEDSGSLCSCAAGVPEFDVI